MADYLTTDTELTSVANAIRTKGGTSAALEWPGGFAQAIADISSGGGVETATVTFTDYTGYSLYYTDANMQACSTVLTSAFSDSMPVGSIAVLTKYAASEPSPFVPSSSGITLLYSHSVMNTSNRKILSVSVYEVTG